MHSGIADVHATGHAKAEELKTLLSIAQPEWFVPVHGEYRHLVAHAKLGRPMGVPRDHVLVCEDGDSLELTDDGLDAARPGAGRLPLRRRHRRRRRPRRAARPPGAGRGGRGRGGRHRRHRDRRKVITGPEIITRGWVYAPEAEDLLDEACDAVAEAVKEALAQRRPRRRGAASATCAAPPASSSTSAPSAAR